MTSKIVFFNTVKDAIAAEIDRYYKSPYTALLIKIFMVG